MKLAALVLSIAFTVSPAAYASTTSGTIGVSATIVPGNTVSAYLIGGQLLTEVSNNASGAAMHINGATPYGLSTLVRISFDMQRSWYLLKRVTWDKIHQQLTIDF